MLKQASRQGKRIDRKRRVRARISGTADRPRLAVFRSLRSITVQAIDDVSGTTLAHARLHEIGKKAKNTVEGAAEVGKLLAQRLAEKGVKVAVFDRSGYRYHGKVKALAEAVRENGVSI